MAFRRPKSLGDCLVHAKRATIESGARRGQWYVKEDDARSVSTRDRVKGVPLTELEKSYADN